MPLYSTILAATDFSKASDAAVRQGAKLASLFGTGLHLLHVIEHFPEDRPSRVPVPEDEDPTDFYTRIAQRRMNQQVDRLGISDTVPHVVFSRRSATRAILEFIDANGIDLLVLGGEPEPDLKALGSTAASLSHRAPCDVLVVRNE